MSELSSLFIKDLPDCYYVRSLGRPSRCVEKNCFFMDHFSRALPTKNIFYLLESIHSGSLMRRRCPAELVFDMLKVIIKWLEVSFRECNQHLENSQTDNPICSRDLVPSDRATCTIASSVHIFVSKKNLRQHVGRQAFHNHQILYTLNITCYI